MSNEFLKNPALIPLPEQDTPLAKHAVENGQRKDDDYYESIAYKKLGSPVDIKTEDEDPRSGPVAYAKDMVGQTVLGGVSDFFNLSWDIGSFLAGTAMNKILSGDSQYSSEFARTFGSDSNSPVPHYKESENIIPSMMRFMVPYTGALKVGKLAMGGARVATSFAAARTLGTSQFMKFGPQAMRVLNSGRVQSIATGALADFMLGARMKGNASTILEDWMERHGYESSILHNWMAVQEGDSAEDRAFKSMLEAGGINLLATIVGPRAIRMAGHVLDKTGAPEKITYAIASAQKKWRQLRNSDPTEAERIQGILREKVALVDGDGKLRTAEPVDYDTANRVDYIDPNAPLPEEKPQMGPEKPGMIDSIMRQGEAVDPNAPGNLLAEQMGQEVGLEGNVRAFYRESRDNALKQIIRKAYDSGELTLVKTSLGRYSKAFWNNVQRSAKEAGVEYSRRDIAFLKKLYEGQAINFSNETGLHPEAYYWHRFGNSSFDAVRTIKDLNAGAEVLHPSAMHQSAKTIIAYDGHAVEVPGAKQRFYSVDEHGNTTRVDYDLPDSGSLDLDQSYSYYAKRNGAEAGRALLEAMAGSNEQGIIGKVMKDHGLGREEAIDAILTGATKGENPVRIGSSILSDFPTSDLEKLKKLGIKQTIKRNGEVEIINVLDQSAVKDFGFTQATHEIMGGATPDITAARLARREARLALDDEKAKAEAGLPSDVPKAEANYRAALDALNAARAARDAGGKAYKAPLEARRKVRLAQNAVNDARWALDEEILNESRGKLGTDVPAARAAYNAALDALDAARRAAAPPLKAETEAAVREAFSAKTAEARDAAVRSIDDPEALKAIIDGLGPDEWVPVVRARGYANAMYPDGEFVEVTTNPRARGDKLWIRKSDIVAPGEDGFFTRSDKAVPEAEFRLEQQPGPNTQGGKPRGAIQFDEDGRSIITLFSGRADKSTFLHETGHLFFRDMEWMKDVPVDNLKKWLGASNAPFDRWPVMAQEKWAKGFERYVATGRAPAGLEKEFRTARNWMKQVYGPLLQSPIAERAPKDIQEFMGKIVSGRTSLPTVVRAWEQQNIFNYDYIKDADDLRMMQEEFAKGDVAIVDRISGKRKTFADVEAEASDKGISVNDLLEMPEGLSHKDAFILRAMKDSSARTVQEMADRFVESIGTAADRAESLADFKKAISVHRALNIRDQIEQRYIGRALVYRKIEVGGRDAEKDYFRAISKVVDAMSDDSLQELAITLQKLRDKPEVISKIIDKVDDPKFFDALHEMFISGLISAPSTLVANALGGIQSVAHMLWTTKMAASGNKLLGREGVNQQDVDSLYMAMLRGVPKGIKLAKEMARDDWVDPGLSDKFAMNHTPQFKGEAFRPSFAGKILYDGEMGAIGRAIDSMGWIIRAPGRAARATDGFFKGVLFEMELQRGAWRETREKVASEIALGNAPTEQQVQMWLHDYVSNPTVDMVLAAKKGAKYQTFAEGFSGTTGGAIGGITKSPIARKIAPFLRIGAELYRFSVVEMTPLGLLTKRFRDRLFSDDMATRQVAQAQLGWNTVAFLAVGDAIDRGVITTGYSNTRKEATERSAEMRRGVGEYSIGITGPDGKYYNISRIAPFGLALTTMARFWDLANHLGEEDAFQLAAKVSAAVADDLTSFGQMQVFTDFYEAMHEQDPDKWSAAIGKIMAGHVPYSGALAAVERTIDPEKSRVKVSPASSTHQEMEQIFAQFESRIPFLSRRLQPEYDLYGREMTLPQNRSKSYFGRAYGFLSPMAMTARDPEIARYEEQYKRLKWFPDPHPVAITAGGKDIDLTDSEIAFYHKEAGTRYKKFLDDNWDTIQRAPEQYRKTIIQSFLGSAREIAKGKLIQNFQRLKATDTYRPEPFTPGELKGGVWGLQPSQAAGIKRP